MRGQAPYGIGTQEDFDRWKPPDKLDYMTVQELANYCARDASWIRRLDREGKLPKAARFKVGRLSVRLYSPAQQLEILRIFRARDKARMTRSRKGRKGVAA
jgi:hypothetical protein